MMEVLTGKRKLQTHNIEYPLPWVPGDQVRITKGDRTLAAALLGIGRTTLYRKLKEYGLDAQGPANS